MKKSSLTKLKFYGLPSKQKKIIQGSGDIFPSTNSIRGQFGQGNNFPFLGEPG